MLLPPKLLGGLALAPLPLSSYAYVLKWLKLSDCEKRFRYTASSEDMQIMRTATPNLLLDGILPLCFKHALFFYKTSRNACNCYARDRQLNSKTD